MIYEEAKNESKLEIDEWKYKITRIIYNDCHSCTKPDHENRGKP